MDEISKHHLVPSLCIALDDSSERILTSVRGFHLRRNAKNKAISEFLRFLLSSPELLTEVNLSAQDINANTPASRSEVFESFVNEQEKVKLILSDKLNQMMEHSRLIDAGITGESMVPFNIFLLADGKDPAGGGQLIPIIVLLLDKLSNFDFAKLHIILNISTFPDFEKKKNDNLQAFSLVQELKEFTNSDSELLKQICKYLEIEIPPFNKATVYLFHHEKFELGRIADNTTMESMIGNSLLHLLSDNLAQENARVSFSSNLTLPITGLGSVLVAYDPEALQNYCAQKKSLEIIDSLILGDGLEGEALMQASQLKNVLGDAEAWTKEVFRTPPDAVSQVIFQPESNDYKVILKEIKLEDIRYLDFKSLNWLEVIEDSEKGIIKNIVTASDETIRTNVNRLGQAWYEKIGTFAVSLPQQSNLYPGGIDSARKALAGLKKLLLDEIKIINAGRESLERNRRKPLAQLRLIQEKIKRIIQNIPDLPIFITKIPERYQELAAGIYYHYAYLIPIIRLRILKRKYLNLVEQITGIDIQLLAAEIIAEEVKSACKEGGIFSDWSAKINQLERSIIDFRNILQLKLDTTSFNGDGGWMDYFRVSLVNEDIAKNIYDGHHQDLVYYATELITNAALFENWQIDFEPIKTKLSSFSQSLFQDLWRLDLVDIDRLYGKLHKPEESPINKKSYRRLFDISQPLLKPNFESKADHNAIQAKYLLKGNTEWPDLNIPADLSKTDNWELIWTDDPYHLIVSQAIHNVDFDLIENLFTEERQKYQSLSEKEKNQLKTVSHLDYVTTISENDEEIIREYRWHFTPKGSNRTYSYSLRLAIDRARYRKYASEERFRTIEEYRVYAQTDMPEINQLVLEFQKIFASVNWSTYNKAFCVLKFVQNAITYQYDQDSKKQIEWPRYPIETLAESVGDCEDVAILSAALLVRLGFEVVLLHYEGHMAFGVCGSPDMTGDYVYDKNTGKKYYYGEATADGWVLGEIPKGNRGNPINIIKVELLVKEENETE